MVRNKIYCVDLTNMLMNMKIVVNLLAKKITQRLFKATTAHNGSNKSSYIVCVCVGANVFALKY